MSSDPLLPPAIRHDWKLYLVIATHLITIGMVYARITAAISSSEEKLLDLRNAVSEGRKDLAVTRAEIASINISTSSLSQNKRAQDETNQALSRRVERLEEILLFQSRAGSKNPR